MARLVTSGFELNDPQATAIANHPDLATTAGGGTYSTANPRSGTYHGRCVWNGAVNKYFEMTVTQTTAVTYWFRSGFYLSALPSGTPGTDGLILISLRTAGGAIGDISVDSGGQLRWDNNNFCGTVSATSYFTLELKHKIDTANAANNLIEVLLNGVSTFTIAGLSAGLGTTIAALWRLGAAGQYGSPGATTVDVDDYALNDSTGASQTGSTGTGKIVLLRPTADSAVGTGWTLGNTTATGGNAWQRVDNAPPDSAADLTTNADAMQIRNATSNANVNYDATMTTYTAAGVGASDTVNVVVPQVATGAPVVTSAKAGTVGVASNPVIANVALAAGGTSGAFWSGVAMGTYPTGNKWSPGTTTYTPTVTLGTAPVMRVTQVTASTRIAIVSEMGIYVDYTPGAVALPPLPVYVDSAVSRSTSY